MGTLISIYLLIGALYGAYRYSQIDFNSDLEEIADKLDCSLNSLVFLMVTVVPLVLILLWPLLAARRMVKWLKTT